MKRKSWIQKLFSPPTPLEVLAEQLEEREVALAEHEQAENFSRAMVSYSRAEIIRLKARIAERMKTDPPPASAPDERT